jgi:hypothetical protein
MKALKSIWWEIPDKSGVALRIGVITPEHAIEILQWKKTDLWDEIMQIRRLVVKERQRLDERALTQTLTGCVTEHAAISWALEQLDIRAEV